MYTLQLPPDQQGFSVEEGNTNIAIQLAGGAPRVRADQLGAVKIVTCQWTVGTANFDYLMAFYRTATNFGALPFIISLFGIDSSNFTDYTAQFIPQTFKPVGSQSGLTFVVAAQMWIWATNDTTNDLVLLTEGPSS